MLCHLRLQTEKWRQGNLYRNYISVSIFLSQVTLVFEFVGTAVPMALRVE